MSKLLTRTEFRNGVFARDNNKCVICKEPSADAHHIMERRLFDDGGYYLDNGASLCSTCHIKAEETAISPEQLREAIGITKAILPSHLYEDQVYDKWGNIVLPNGERLKGELFYDESVQKIIAPYLSVFTQYVKYPRTHHLPWSQGMHDDDRMHSTVAQWQDREVVITLKMDGENTTMYNDHIHARSLDSKKHPSRSWVKQFWSTISHEIPEGWRVCGENLYAKHSIGYDDLRSYFYGFSVWNDKNVCLSWDDTIFFFEGVGIHPVKVIYQGKYNQALMYRIHEQLDFEKNEGYVLRLADSFTYSEFRKYVGKFVRKNHIQTTKHWLHGQEMVVNTCLTHS